MVALPCGSRSISSTRRRVAARDAARLTAVVVLPTPPFWFAMAMTRFMGDSVLRHRVGRAILAPGAFEDLRQPRGNPLDIGNDLLFGGAAVILARNADNAAGIDHVVRRVQDPGRLQRQAI